MIKLGSKVKDVVSGFKGVAVGEYNFLHGCTRYCVQPPVNDKGEIPENQYRTQLKVVSKSVQNSIDGTLNKKPGGPPPNTPKRRQP